MAGGRQRYAHIGRLGRLEHELAQATTERRTQQRQLAIAEAALESKTARRLEDRQLENVNEDQLYALFKKHRSADSSQQASAFQKNSVQSLHIEDHRRAKLADIAGNGLDRWELTSLLAELGLLAKLNAKERDVASKQWLAALDADGNGTIEWSELRRWWRGGGQASGDSRGRSGSGGGERGGSFKMLGRPPHEIVTERLSTISQWLPRTPPRSPRTTPSSPRPLSGGGWWPPPSPTSPRVPASTAAERRAIKTNAWHGRPHTARTSNASGSEARPPPPPAPRPTSATPTARVPMWAGVSD